MIRKEKATTDVLQIDLDVSDSVASGDDQEMEAAAEKFVVKLDPPAQLKLLRLLDVFRDASQVVGESLRNMTFTTPGEAVFTDKDGEEVSLSSDVYLMISREMLYWESSYEWPGRDGVLTTDGCSWDHFMSKVSKTLLDLSAGLERGRG